MKPRARYCLLDQPWIPVLEGREVREVSLLQALRGASGYQAIEHADPLVVLSLHRLLLAFLHRALQGPRSGAEVVACIASGFPEALLEPYADRWRERFDLFCPRRPFLQQPGIEREAFRDSWRRLKAATGNANSNFLYRDELRGLALDAEAISAAEAARLLVAHQTFALGGLIKRLVLSTVDAPSAGNALVLARGDCLLETLCLNLVPGASDPPVVWELDRLPTLAQLEQGVALAIGGPAQCYVWPARSILLEPDPDGLVSTMYYAAGCPNHDEGFRDPMVTLLSGGAPLKLRPGIASWRSLARFVPSLDSAPVLRHARAILDETGGSQRSLRFEVIGLERSKAKLLDVRREGLRLPAWIEPGELEEWLAVALEGESLLTAALKAVAGAILDDKDRVAARMTAFGHPARYWSTLETTFWRFLDRAQDGRSATDWRALVFEHASRLFDSEAASLGCTGLSLRAVELGWRTFKERPSPPKAVPVCDALCFGEAQRVVARLQGCVAPFSRRPTLTLAAALREADDAYRVRTERSWGSWGTPLERRFLALLDCPEWDALARLEGLAREVLTRRPIDWSQLLTDLKAWSCPERTVQKRWAYEFYAMAKIVD